MYESHYTHHFFRLWGAREGAEGLAPDTVLLGNSQNDFDAKFGDLAGQVGLRYFLVEFKTDRAGIAQEVGITGKPHRHALYQHLRNDSNCELLASVGHFAGYPENGLLVFEPYGHAVAQRQPRKDIVDGIMLNDKPWHALDYARKPLAFDAFYTLLNNIDGSLTTAPSGFFSNGIGLPLKKFEEYIECMYQHLEQVVDDKGTMLLGITHPGTGVFIYFKETVPQLITRLHSAFNALRATIPPRPTPPANPAGIP
ncbi:hypothetical protein IGS61_10465 [Janthinobacterium sp. FW305-129]|uniref:hypothetical protein n=1 Tax=Janthinobacterium sp. FW305-129 TaxID=2775054 RepID=UPI001E530D56|nr:hypothetical protein [Janthinobacterium sp. FW305-129]MCC7597912.1 hypothetical protein [Janthinobacterium sp. FW305-129]